MKEKVLCVIMAILGTISSYSQNIQINEENVSITKANRIIDETEKRGVSSTVHLFESTEIQKIDDSYVLKFETSSPFTCFGIGIKSSNNELPAGHFKFAFKTERASTESQYGYLKTGEGEFTPDESTTGLYWSELFFGYDETARKKLFIIITPPEGISINQIRIDVMDLSKEIDPTHAKEIQGNYDKSIVCPAMPMIIQRANWCGNYTACTNASYTPTSIIPTHTIIHHGASPDTYTDGYAVVRSYWNYHVNTMGWADIGYNYLIDKFGNIFLGRKNANYTTQDVRGSHAGNSNDKSIGVNFLGNGDVSTPTTIQLQKLYNLLGWWFKSRNITPNTSASIVLQSGGTAILPRIVGHKDVNIGGTACPGTTIYGLLGTIRNQTVQTINSCIDNIKPTTNCTIPNSITTDFTATFTDCDNTGGSGINYKFYQVSDYNGSEYRSNKDFGFYNDNFNATIHPDWTTSAGTWNISGGELNQQDNLATNSNIYTSLSQTTGTKYLYNWKMKISGINIDRGAGIHFFCSDASQVNRANSYLVYCKPEQNKIQIIECLNNIMTVKAEINCIISPEIQYDYKVIFNSINGEINVYQNDIFLLSWTDLTPLTIGNQVSFRTSKCVAKIDDFRIFKSRSNSTLISVGNSPTKEIRYQNSTLTSISGKIVSITSDIAKNISLEVSKSLSIDFWGPFILTNVNDGLSSDISTQTSLTTISANWLSTTDPNNIISSYSYAIGTNPGATNIVDWTSNGLNTSFTKTGLTLLTGTTYYVSVRSTNASGLNSTAKSSNGVQILTPKMQSSTTETNDFNLNKQDVNIYPNPVTDILHLTGIEKGSIYNIIDIRGQSIKNEKLDNNLNVDVSDLPNGVYFIQLTQNDCKKRKRFVKI